jgi:hypothetical protein
LTGFIDGAFSNIDFIPTKMIHEYTVIDAFEKSKGKFGNALGNVALIDCKYAKRLIESFYL